MSLDLHQIIDIDSLSRLLDAFYFATGITTAIVALDGKIVVNAGWRKICTDFHRIHPATEKKCRQSDAKAKNILSQGEKQVIYQCLNGLIDAATPIVVNDTHIANLFTGQLLLDPPDAQTKASFKARAAEYGFDEKDYLEALLAVPVISEKRLKATLQYLKELAEIIGETGYHRLQLKKREESITDAQAALKQEIRLRKAEAEKLAQILEGSSIPTFVIDANCRVTHWNRSCELLTGILASDIIGTDDHRQAFYNEPRKGLADFIVEDASPHERDAVYGDNYRKSPLIRDGYEGKDFFPKLGENGKWLYFTAGPIKDADGNVLGAIETLQDITERHEAEQKLRASESRYHQLFESANDGLIVLKDGHVVDCNPKTLEIFNVSREEMIGRSTLDFSPEIQPHGRSSKDEIQTRQKLLRRGVRQFFDWRFLHKNGSSFDAEVSLNQTVIDDAPHTLAIIRDTTKRKKLILTLQERERELDEKSRYLEKVNQALKASLDNREVEKRAIEENMMVNLKRFVFPYIEELTTCMLDTDARAYLDIIETNLNDIMSRFSKMVFWKYQDLTPTEVRIADLIRSGKNTKAIAKILNLSPSSVQWHRKNIREKLGLTNKKVNLQTYLASLSE